MKKFLVGLTALPLLAIAVSTAQAGPRSAELDNGVTDGKETMYAQRMNPGTGGVADPRVPPIESTGFEADAPDGGWELGFMCGPEFAACTEPATPGCLATQPGCMPDGSGCNPNPYGPGNNCCANWPNVDNGWFTTTASKSCTEPSISNVHPAPGGGTQHMRFQIDTSGQLRMMLFSPINGIGVQGPTTISFDLSGSGLGGSKMTFGMLGSGDPGPATMFLMLMYFETGIDPANGYIFVYDPDIGDRALIGYWAGGADNLALDTYRNVRIESEPCRGLDTVKYYYDGVLLHTHSAHNVGANDIDRWTFQNPTTPATYTNKWDLDNFVITRGSVCPVICGDGFTDIPEECDPGDGALVLPDDANCPGRCNAVGEPDQCTCDRICADCANACVAVNGDNGPFLTSGGFYTYTADTEFITFETCDWLEDTVLFWDFDPVACDHLSYSLANDDCINSTYGGFQPRGTPAASCYVDPRTAAFPGAQSCMCIPTTPGTTYTFAVLSYYDSTPPAGSEARFNINKKLSCTDAGVCSNSCNGSCTTGTCDLGTAGVCGLGVCGSGICEGVCNAGTVGAPCKGDAVCDVPPTPIVPGVCEGTCVAGLPPGTSCKGNASCDIIPGDGSGICGFGSCQVSLLPCMGDFECPPTGGDPGIAGICEGTCNQGILGIACKGDSMCDNPGVCTVGSPGVACVADADCNQCTAGTVGLKCPTGADAACDIPPTFLCLTGPRATLPCLSNAECNACTVGNVGADCAASADCLACTRGPNIGTACTVATQVADCGGKFCSVGDVGALCTNNAGCTVEGEKVPGGACCDEETDKCNDAVMTPEECTGDKKHYHPGKLCEFLDPPCGSQFCGPGPSWINGCPPGTDTLDTGLGAAIDLTLDPLCLPDAVPGWFSGPTVVNRLLGVGGIIPQEIVSGTLTNGVETFRIGAPGPSNLPPTALPLAASLGQTYSLGGNPELAGSFFDVFFEINLGTNPGGLGPYLYNQTAVRVESADPLTKAPPHDDPCFAFHGCIPLYSSPDPGPGQEPEAQLPDVFHCIGKGIAPPGACCDGTTGTCVNGVGLGNCIGEQKVWHPNKTCDQLDPPCAEHTGACCDQRIADPALRCQDDVPESLCPIDDPRQVQWYKDTPCSQIDCPEHTGACCDEDTFGGCENNVPASACNTLKKGVFYKDMLCSEITCLHNPIPTVSEWGIVVLTLLLLVGAKVYFGRRQTAAA